MYPPRQPHPEPLPPGRSLAPPRRRALQGLLASGALLGLGAPLTGCTAENHKNAEAPALPDYYPADYAQLVDASRREDELLLYSNTPQTALQPLFDGFTRRYPWISRVRATNFSSSAVFQRYYSERATGGSPVDLLLSISPTDWADYAQRGIALDYESVELSRLPDFAEILPRVFVLSTDPNVVLYNRKTLAASQHPKGLRSMADLCEAHPSRYRGKIGIYDTTNPFGYSSNSTYTTDAPGGWSHLRRLLPFCRPENSSGSLTEKVISGEYDAAVHVGGTVAIPIAERSGGLLGWTFYEEGTVAVPRALSIVETAPHPNAARLFLDYVLSAAGQQDAVSGGLGPYRPGTEGAGGIEPYQGLIRRLGKNRVFLAPYKGVADNAHAAYVRRWNSARK